MKLEHVAVSNPSEEESDKFFMGLLNLKKTRTFKIHPKLTQKFFGINKEPFIIRYYGNGLDVEVFITEDNTNERDKFAHICLSIENREEFLERAKNLGFPTIKAVKNDGESYYLFIKDSYGNLYEIK
ncbi:MAG: VOC family protein [Promethearchaeota archaeon]